MDYMGGDVVTFDKYNVKVKSSVETLSEEPKKKNVSHTLFLFMSSKRKRDGIEKDGKDTKESKEATRGDTVVHEEDDSMEDVFDDDFVAAHVNDGELNEDDDALDEVVTETYMCDVCGKDVGDQMMQCGDGSCEYAICVKCASKAAKTCSRHTDSPLYKEINFYALVIDNGDGTFRACDGLHSFLAFCTARTVTALRCERGEEPYSHHLIANSKHLGDVHCHCRTDADKLEIILDSLQAANDALLIERNL